MTKTYYSQRSYIILLMVALPLLAPLVLTIEKFSLQSLLTPRVILPILLILLTFVFIYGFFNLRYTIDKDRLDIYYGFFSYKLSIDINSIRKIEKSRSILSAPAASMNRIEIHYNKFDSILISPKDQQEFINDLCQINPNIKTSIESK